MTHINQRRDTAAAWTALNPVLQLGEVGRETDTRLSKTGDGSTPWNDLLYNKAGGLTKADVGLDNVDNTSDMNKPVSTAQQALVIDSIADGDATHAPSRNAVYDAIQAQQAYTDAKIVQTVTNGDTTHVPSADAVYDMVTTATAGAAVTGTVTMYAGSTGTVPPGYLLCDGQAVDRDDYADLFDAIGTTYGVGDGSTTFNVPDMRGRVCVGKDAAQTEFNTLNKSGGAKTHTLSIGEMPSHNHAVSDPGHQHDFEGQTISWGLNGGDVHFQAASSGNRIDAVAGPSAGTGNGMFTDQNGDGWTDTYNAGTGITVGSTGGGSPHNNLQPYLTLNFLIKT